MGDKIGVRTGIVIVITPWRSAFTTFLLPAELEPATGRYHPRPQMLLALPGL